MEVSVGQQHPVYALLAVESFVDHDVFIVFENHLKRQDIKESVIH